MDDFLAWQQIQRRHRQVILALLLVHLQPERPLIPQERFNFADLDNASCRAMFQYDLFYTYKS